MSILSANVPVPVAGDGPAVDVSGMVGPKTVVLTGGFSGYYELLASHLGTPGSFTSILKFDAGAAESVRQTVSGAFRYFRVRSGATAIGPVTCEVSALAGLGLNRFLTVGNLPAGFQGLSPVVDTAVALPPTGAEADICFICVGSFVGSVLLMGSIDGVDFNPIGSFRADDVPEGSPTSVLEFSVLATEDKTRYLRLSVGALDAVAGVLVTMGGSLLPSGGGGGGASDNISPIASTTGRATTLNAAGEELLYEVPVDLDAVLPGVPITPLLLAVVGLSAPSTGTFRLYVGSTTPGDTTGGTLLATLSTSTPADTEVFAPGAPFLNPGGKVLVQITGINDTPASAVSEMLSFFLRLA